MSEKFVKFVIRASAMTALTCILIVAISMSIIIDGLLRDKIRRKLSEAETAEEAKDDEEEETSDKTSEYSIDKLKRTLVKQALLYIGVFVSIWLAKFLSLFSPSPILQFWRVISNSAQSFSNSSIFLYHKVHNLRRLHPYMSIQQALHSVIVDPFPTTDLKLSGLSIISRDNRLNTIDGREANCHLKEAGVDDASKDMHLSFGLSKEASYMLDLDFEFLGDMKRSGTRPRADKENVSGTSNSPSSGRINDGDPSNAIPTGVVSKLCCSFSQEDYLEDDSGLSHITLSKNGALSISSRKCTDSIK